MKRIYLIVFIIGLVLPLNVNAGWWNADPNGWTPRLSEDNGSGNWGKFWVHGNTPRHQFAVNVVGGGHPTRAGAQSIRFERRTGFCYGNDCGRKSERTELGADGKDRPGDNRWYAWSVYHKDYKWLKSVAPIHGQFKTMGEHMPGRSGHNNVFFMMDIHRGMVVHRDALDPWSKSEVIIPKNQINNKWNDIRIHAKWSTGADGIFQVWVNGVLKVDWRGRNTLDNDPIAFRFGIYAPQADRAGSGRPTQVVYYDELMRGNSCKSVSQFMSCPGGGNKPPTNGGGKKKKKDFVKYVNMHGDLKAAYKRNAGGKTKAAWGKWHYCNYGKKEGRQGLTPAHCAGNISTTKPRINTTVAKAGSRGGDRFTSEISNGVRKFSKVAILNGNVFSFKDYLTFTAYETRENRGLMLGFSPETDSNGGIIEPIGVGWLFDNVAVMVANDNSMLGYKAEGIFDFKDPNTTYVDVGYRKKFSDTLILHNDIIYAFGRSEPGKLVTMSDIHALGFESKLHYTPTNEHKFIFTFDMPLHVERGSSQFTVSQLGTLYDLNIDMVPDGRQMNLGMNHIYQLTKASNFTTVLSYTDDLNHRRGTNDYLAMVKYNISF